MHEGVRVVHLHADHLDLRSHRLDVVGHARNQSATAYGHKHGIETVRAETLQLAQYLHRNRALAGNHVRVVKRVHKGQTLLFFQRCGVRVGVRVAVAKEHDLTAKVTDCVNLDLRCGGRHHDDGARAQFVRAQGHPLCMVAGGGADHAFFQLLRRQMCHPVVGATQLEAVHRLLVLAFEQHAVVQASAQGAGRLQRRLDGNVIDACRQDLFQVVGGGQVMGLHGSAMISCPLQATISYR